MLTLFLIEASFSLDSSCPVHINRLYYSLNQQMLKLIFSSTPLFLYLLHFVGSAFLVPLFSASTFFHFCSCHPSLELISSLLIYCNLLGASVLRSTPIYIILNTLARSSLKVQYNLITSSSHTIKP